MLRPALHCKVGSALSICRAREQTNYPTPHYLFRMKKILAILGLVFVSMLLLFVALVFYFRPHQGAPLTKPPEHGIAFLLEIDASEAAENTNLMAEVRQVMLKRFWRFGTRVFWETVSTNRARIISPVVSSQNIELAQSHLFNNAFLEFRLVHEHSEEMIKQGFTEIGYEKMTETHDLPRGRQETVTYLVKKKPEQGLTSKYMMNAMADRDQNGQPEILFNLNREGAEIFEKVTTENVGRQLAIILDGKVHSAPLIRSPITGGRGQLAGYYTEQQAHELANLLESSLPTPVKLVESKTF
jgi:preprotein translocase subunit SecD